eukprot:TRINITY_DN5259_c0_g1_i1.p1 TRINITY_DN5259_c0_g1~~TRINITY_DN5259_c0_g1_i1.p1  ORF type:complete len:468 (+),score=135.71 TRINITY_DN5259_c0_g1_i1:270-1673(+)
MLQLPSMSGEMSWGDIGALTTADDGGGSGIDLGGLRDMLRRGSAERESARSMLELWLDLNGEDPEKMQEVLRPEHMDTVVELLQGGCASPRRGAGTLRAPPCGSALPKAAQAEAVFLLRLRQFRETARGAAPAAFGDAGFADPCRGGIAAAVAASKRRMLAAMLQGGFLERAMAPLRDAAAQAGGPHCRPKGPAGQAMRFLSEMLLIARRCGDDVLRAELCSRLCGAEAGAAQAAAALVATPLRPQAADALLLLAQGGTEARQSVRQAVAAESCMRILAAACRPEPTAEEMLLTELLQDPEPRERKEKGRARGISPGLRRFADAFAAHALPRFTSGPAACRLIAAWAPCRRSSRAARRHLAAALARGAAQVAAAAAGDSASGCAAADALRLATALASRRSAVLSAALHASGLPAAADCAAVSNAVTEGGLLHQAIMRFLAEWHRAAREMPPHDDSEDTESDVSDDPR